MMALTLEQAAMVLCGVGAAFRWLLRGSDAWSLHDHADIIPKDLPTEEECDARFDHAMGKLTRTGGKYLITGGGGFMGKRLVRHLLKRGETKVSALDLQPTSPFKESEGVEYIRGDITNIEQMDRACKGCDVVIHVAAIIRYMDNLPHQYAISHKVNVTGTKVVLDACVANNVPFVLQVSSSNVTIPKLDAEVVFDFDEDSPYVTPENTPSHYNWTKTQAEMLAREYHGKALPNGGTLSVGIIRPCSAIFGPEDGLITERMIRANEVRVLGTEMLIDYVYVDNVIYAMLLLEHKHHAGDKAVVGMPICVSNNDPMPMIHFFAALAKFLDPKIKMTYDPRRIVVGLSHLVQLKNKYLGSTPNLGLLELLTPAMLDSSRIQYRLKSDRASKLLGYTPPYATAAAIRKTVRGTQRSMNESKKTM